MLSGSGNGVGFSGGVIRLLDSVPQPQKTVASPNTQANVRANLLMSQKRGVLLHPHGSWQLQLRLQATHIFATLDCGESIENRRFRVF